MTYSRAIFLILCFGQSEIKPHGVKGSLIECGCFLGGAAAFIGLMRIKMFDSDQVWRRRSHYEPNYQAPRQRPLQAPTSQPLRQ
jgi:hypothetical protein